MLYAVRVSVRDSRSGFTQHGFDPHALHFMLCASCVFECRGQPWIKLHSQGIQRHRHQGVLTYSKYDVDQLLDIVVLTESLPRCIANTGVFV
jgi:hypothetical protein